MKLLKNIIAISTILISSTSVLAQPGFNGHGPNDFTMSTIQNKNITAPMYRVVDNSATVHYRNYYHKDQMINFSCSYPQNHQHHEHTNLNSDVSI